MQRELQAVAADLNSKLDQRTKIREQKAFQLSFSAFLFAEAWPVNHLVFASQVVLQLSIDTASLLARLESQLGTISTCVPFVNNKITDLRWLIVTPIPRRVGRQLSARHTTTTSFASWLSKAKACCL